MAPNIIALPALKLKALRQGPSITIRYRPTPQSESLIIADNFPRGIATTFSGLCEKTFPLLNKISVNDLKKPKSNMVIIEGGNLEAHKDVLEWMSSCCDGKGIQPFKVYLEKPFWNLALAYESAQKFDICYLQQKLWDRLIGISKKQVHSDDLAMIYAQLPRGHQMQIMAFESIAYAIHEKRVKAFGAYEVLKKSYPQFDEDLTAFFNERRADSAAAKKAVQEERKEAWKAKQEARKAEHKEKTKESWARHIQETQAVEGAEVKEVGDGHVRVTTECAVVRKGGKGRGKTYVKPPMSILGLTAANFRQHNPPIHRATRKATPKADEKGEPVIDKDPNEKNGRIADAKPVEKDGVVKAKPADTKPADTKPANKDGGVRT